MAKKNECWGIEVGYNALKAIHLVRTESELVVADFEVLPFKKILTTPDLNVDEQIQVNLDQFLSRHNLTKTNVMISVPGHAAFARFAKLPPVDPKKIPDIVKFEAVQQIPFPIDQVEWDYQVFAQADSPDVEVGIFAITKDRVMQMLNNYRAVGLSPDGMTLSPLAVYNAMAYDMELGPDSPGVIFMDIGTVSTDVIIVENGQIWPRTLPIGGNNFTDALVRAFKLSFPKAEKLKRDAATSKYARQIFQAMRPVFADLVQEMQRSLGYYQSLNRDAQLTKLVGIGSTFRLPGLVKFLKQQLQIDVVRADTFKRIRIEGKREAEFAEHTLNMATAYGLALQGLDLERVNANLLPRHIIKQRLWKAKQPWIAGAAVLTMAASVAAGVRLWNEQASYQADFIKSSDRVTRIFNDATKLRNDWQEIEGGRDPRQQIENLRRILDYRDVWPKLMLDLDMAALNLRPQQELLTADYDLIQQVPRGDRRRIYVESIAAEYRLGDQPIAGRTVIPGGPTGPMSMDEIFGTRSGEAPRAQQEPAAGPRGGARRGAPAAPKPAQPPSFVITLRGTTPFEDGLKFIGDNYIRWLQESAKRSDRPYEIIATDESVIEMERIGSAATATPTPTLSVADARVPLPRRPQAEALSPSDWRFVIQWRIQLVRPEDSRQSEQEDIAPGNEAPAPPSAAVIRTEDQL